MKELSINEIQNVNGGCYDLCWGDFEAGGLLAAGVGGAIAGIGGGPMGMLGGSAGGMVAYMLEVMWTD